MNSAKHLQQNKLKFSDQEKKEEAGASALRWNLIPLALLSMAFLSITGCVEGHPFHGTIRAAPSPVLQLSWAIARRTDAGIIVRGQITQVKCCAPSVAGHLHITAAAGNGLIASEKDVPWGDFVARQLHSASFKARLVVPKHLAVTKVEIHFITPSPMSLVKTFGTTRGVSPVSADCTD